MRFIIFATIFLTVFALLSLYIYKRFICKLDIKKRYKTSLIYFLVINFFGIIAYMMTRYLVSVPNEIYFLLSLPIGVLFILFITTLIFEFLNQLPKTIKDEKRRAFFKKSIDVGSIALALGLSSKAAYNAKNTLIEDVEIKIKNLKQSYKIVQLSDVHIGGIIDKEFIASMVEKVNTLNADIVVITGDLIDTNLSFVIDVVDELKNLKSKYGTHFIVGNHEYFHGARGIMDYLSSIGINVLENENVYIGEEPNGFNLAGVYDVMGYRVDSLKPDINKALIGTSSSPTVLLAHQPKYIEEVVNVDLVLSGHTHGGQIQPFGLLVKLQQPYLKGLHKHNETTQIYVNKGTGFWGPPMRLGSNAEISNITITPA